MPHSASTHRRHDLDWLRAIAFGLLILYHIGMFYVTWGWHVKSTHMSPAIEPLMALLNPWRLPLLFVISGIALHFAMDRAPLGKFLRSRTARLALPVLFGMVVTVAPQAYFELRTKGEIGPDFWAFYADYLDFGMEFSILTPTYNHLWYLVYILIYTLLVALLMPVLARLAPHVDRAAQWLGDGAYGWRLMLVPVLPFLAIAAFLAPHFPVTMAVIDDWANHANLLSMLLIGWLIAKSDMFWRQLDRHLRPILITVATLAAILLVARLNWPAVRAVEPTFVAIMGVRTLYMWLAVLAMLGMAQRYLMRRTALLDFLNQRVFAYYVLHQTIIVSLGFWLAPRELPVWLEASLLIAATLVLCIVLTEAIRPIPGVRVLFGLRGERHRPTPVRQPA